MEFGIDIPTDKEFDAVALGLNAVDHLIVVPSFPEFNSKHEFISHTLAAGGQAATAMVALSRLGMRTRYIGNVGSDQDGQFQIESLKQERVDISCLKIIEGARTQSAFILVDQPSGERTILWKRDQKLALDPDSIDRAAVTSGRVLLLDGHDTSAAIRAAAYAREAGIPVLLDIDNIYPGADRLLPLIDFLISSGTFPFRMTGIKDLESALKSLAATTGATLIGATLGSEGVLAYFQDRFIRSPAFNIECKDTTGAGDAFHSGFIYGLLAGFSVEETLRFSNAVAALKCRAIGARTGLPALEEVEAFLGAR